MIALILVGAISLADTSQSDARCCLVPSCSDFAFASDPAFMVKSFQTEMKKAGKSLVVNNYDAGHAFANPSNPGHNKEYTTDAWKKTIAFYRANLMEKH